MKSLRLLLVCMLTAPAVAAADCKPVVGSFEATLVPAGQGHCPAMAPFCTAGRVWGGVQGSYQFVMTAAESSAMLGGVPSIQFFAGKSTVRLKSGAQIVGTDTGSIDLQPGRGGFASLITFEGSTTGQIKLRGDFDGAAGTTNGDYLGELCQP